MGYKSNVHLIVKPYIFEEIKDIEIMTHSDVKNYDSEGRLFIEFRWIKWLGYEKQFDDLIQLYNILESKDENDWCVIAMGEDGATEQHGCMEVCWGTELLIDDLASTKYFSTDNMFILADLDYETIDAWDDEI